MKRFFKIFFITVAVIAIAVATNFLMVRNLNNDVMEEEHFYTSTFDASKPHLLPSQFIDGARFYIKMKLATGDTALAYGDSGGGISLLSPFVLDKLKLRSFLKTGLAMGIVPFKYVFFSDLVADPNIPPPVPSRSHIVRTPFRALRTPALIIPPVDDEIKFANKAMAFDIFLGQNFFMGNAWTIDYPNQQIWVNTPLKPTDSNVQKIGFRTNSHDEKVYGHASMYIEVDGELIPVLFDTGASIVLSENGKKLLVTNKTTIAGSFIAAEIFDKWHTKHPDWKYYPQTDMKADVIEVPAVKIGRYTVGPALFAKRPAEAWSKNMIHSMDHVVSGAVGGSALKYLKVTIDYNSNLIRFEKSGATTQAD